LEVSRGLLLSFEASGSNITFVTFIAQCGFQMENLASSSSAGERIFYLKINRLGGEVTRTE
jgi:hypothetical protein